MTNVLNGLNGQNTGALSNTANVATSDPGSYTTNYNANGAPLPFGYFTAFDTDTDFSAANGTNGAAITEKFFELVPGANSGVLLGTFSLDQNGNLSFVSAVATAVPEPGTYALLVTGALLFGVTWRKRKVIAR